MEDLREQYRQTREQLRSLVSRLTEPALLSDADEDALLDVVRWSEDLGRLTDAARIGAAGEVAARCKSQPTPTTLADRFGCATPTELLERVARISDVTARSRMRLGLSTRAGTTLTGDPLPAEFDTVRRGLESGRLGVDSATLITRMLSRAKVGVPTDLLPAFRQAEHELVCAAIGAPAEPGAPEIAPVPPFETAVHAQIWEGALSPDGREPVPRFEARGFVLRQEKDGLIPVTGNLLPDVAGQVQAVLDSLTNAHQSVKFLTNEQRKQLEVAEGPREPRTKTQRQHDALTAVFDLAGRSGELPTLGGASPTMVVTILNDHDAHGGGYVDGIDARLSASAVEQLCCANGIQPLQLHSNGKVHRLGTTERCFNRSQRRMLAARDGGCVICGYPPQYTEAHHVIPWAQIERTHVDNGVLLCWYHHRTIDNSGWRIRMVNGAPEVMPPPGLGPPVWQPAHGSRIRQAAALTRRLHNQR